MIAFAATSTAEDLPPSGHTWCTVRIKLDENIPARLARERGDLEPDVETVAGEGLTGKDDGQIWHACPGDDRGGAKRLNLDC